MTSPWHLVLNWLWQGALVTLLAALAVGACRAMNAATRERIWWITLIAVMGIPLLHLIKPLLGSPAPGPASGDEWAPPLTVALPAAASVSVAAGWIAWTTLALVQVGMALVQLQRTKKRVRPFPADREARLPSWAAVAGRGRLARLVVSEHVHRAAVLGLARPVIALAPATIARLRDEELDQIIVHEYAHIQRRDDIAIVAQRLVAAVAGFHPAVWWLDRAITTEREVACDDWVVAHTGAFKRYALCLIELAAPAPSNRWSLVPGAAVSRPELTIRIRRLLDRGRNASIARSRPTLWLAQPMVIAFALACGTLPLVSVVPRQARDLYTDSARAAASTAGGTEAATKPPGGVIASQERHQPARRAPEITGSGLAPPRVRPRSMNNLPERQGPVVQAVEARDGVDEPTSSLETNQGWLPSVPAPMMSTLPDTERAAIPEGLPLHEPVWDQVAAAGIAIGKRSRDAASSTASFFARFGKSVASSF